MHPVLLETCYFKWYIIFKHAIVHVLQGEMKLSGVHSNHLDTTVRSIKEKIEVNFFNVNS